MVDILNVVVVLKVLDEKVHILDIALVCELNVVLGDLIVFSREDSIACCLKSLTNCCEVGCLSEDLVNVAVGSEVCSACLKSSLHESILVDFIVLVDDDNALIVEHEGNAADLAEISAILIEEVTNLTACTVTVICSSNYDNSNTGGAVSLVYYLFVVSNLTACSLLDSAVDVVVGNVVCLSLSDKIAELSVTVGVSTAVTNCDSDLFTDLCEDLTLLGVGLSLFVFDIIPFRMSGPGFIPFKFRASVKFAP